jgi:hypothetical protein
VEEDGLVDVLDLGQEVDEPGQVVAVDGAHVLDAHGLEHRAVPHAGFDRGAEGVPGVLDGVGDAGGELVDELFGEALELFVSRGDADAFKVLGEGALGGRDAHPVVI